MDMNRRTALKSLLALALAPTVSLRRGVDREALLAAFCDNDSCSGASVRFDILTPFMGVGSEVYGAVLNGRKGVGIELKPSYYRQAVKNVPKALEKAGDQVEGDLLAELA